jgi:hypothetical protein
MPESLCSQRRLALDYSLCKYVVSADHVVAVADMRGGDLELGSHPLLTEHGVRSFLSVPVRDAKDRPLGALTVLDTRISCSAPDSGGPRPGRRRDRQLLALLGGFLGGCREPLRADRPQLQRGHDLIPGGPVERADASVMELPFQAIVRRRCDVVGGRQVAGLEQIVVPSGRKVLVATGEQAAAESARNRDLMFDDKAPHSLLDEFAAYRDV